MAILNKKSMLFLLATILLICSSYADDVDHLSSAGREERVLINSGNLQRFFEGSDVLRLVKGLKKTKKSEDLVKELLEQLIQKYEEENKNSYDHLNKICTDHYHCNPSDKCRGSLCAAKYLLKQDLDCKTECGGKK